MFSVFKKHFELSITKNTKFLVSKENYNLSVTVNFHDTMNQPLSYDSKKYVIGQKYSEFPTYQTPSGYRFKNWSDKKANGKIITTDSKADFITTNIYSQYVKLINITFDGDGGELDIGGQTYTGQFAPSFPFNEYTFPYTCYKSGYKFNGWYTEKGCQGQQITESSLCPNVSTTYYAGYLPLVNITYDADGGVFNDTGEETKTVQYPPGEELYYTYFPYSDVYKSDYQFVGWFTQKGGQGEEIGGYTLCPNSPTTYYAHWISMVTITFDADGGTCDNGEPTQSFQCMPGSYMADYFYAPYAWKENYQFGGWYSEKGGGGNYFDNYDYCPYQNTTYYAYWLEMVAITFNYEGGYDEYGEPGPSTRSFMPYECYYYYGSFPSVTKENKMLDGWYTEQSGQGTKINPYDSCDPSITAVYANWIDKPNLNTVKYAGTYGNYQSDGPVIGTITSYDGNTCVVQFNGASEIQGYSNEVTFYLNDSYCTDGSFYPSGYENFSYNWWYPGGYSFDIYIKFVEV